VNSEAHALGVRANAPLSSSCPSAHPLNGKLRCAKNKLWLAEQFERNSVLLCNNLTELYIMRGTLGAKKRNLEGGKPRFGN